MLSKGYKIYNSYLEIVSLVERLHRHFLEVVKLELDGLGIRDINNVQGFDTVQHWRCRDDRQRIDAARLLSRLECVVQIKKMVENGYISQERSVHDRRSTNVRLTEKGTKLRDRLRSMHQRYAEMLERAAITDEDLHAAAVTLDRLEHFWTRGPAINAAAA